MGISPNNAFTNAVSEGEWCYSGGVRRTMGNARSRYGFPSETSAHGRLTARRPFTKLG